MANIQLAMVAFFVINALIENNAIHYTSYARNRKFEVASHIQWPIL